MAKERISVKKRAMALTALFEGLGVNATCRLTGMAKEQLPRPIIEEIAGIELLAGDALPGLTTNSNGPMAGDELPVNSSMGMCPAWRPRHENLCWPFVEETWSAAPGRLIIPASAAFPWLSGREECRLTRGDRET